MNIACLLPLLKEMPAYRQLLKQLSSSKCEHKTVILNAAKPYFIAALYCELGLPLIVIRAQPDNARKLWEQLKVWCPPSVNLQHFTELDLLPYESFTSYNTNTMQERLQVLSNLAFLKKDDKPPLIITSALAVITKTISQEDFTSYCQVLEQGMAANPLELIYKWQSMGYETENVVEMPGQLSRRGGTVDIYAPCHQSPVRIEFLGNRIESMRLFDPESQRSIEPISSLTITPARETVVPIAKQLIDDLNLDCCSAEVKQQFTEDVAKMQEGKWFPNSDFYSPLFNKGNILDYLGEDALIVLDAPEEIEAITQKLCDQAQELRKVNVEHGKLPEGFPNPYLDWNELRPKVTKRQCLVLESWSTYDSDVQTIPFTSSQSYGGRLQDFLKAAKQMIEQHQRVLVVSHQANRLAELFQEGGIHTEAITNIEQAPPCGSVTLLQGSLDQGWVVRNILNLTTDAELFGFVKQARPSRKAPLKSSLLVPQLKSGDYVVHVDYGIAKFNGLTKMSTDGIEREYLILEYARSDRLYVPTEQIGRISRYIGVGEQTPHLSSLGTREWERTKKRVQESVADVVRELLNLYASREITHGFAFSADTLWQEELEASFPYAETPDQIEAIMAVKEDMETAKPMDRLICGDVGYGKTEVALRAAFKVVMDNKQVAILVPTTILAQQHFTTFSQRLQAFPLKVEMLSRFCSRDKEQEILEGLANGTIDMCIGTHRLLQKDVSFKDLGMVIIDEEQRFGVMQKEKLKQIRKEVDVLTLSATPIPRTLHMTLTGIRDMTIMETPPEERQSIKTHIGAYDADLLSQAVLRELERNGQVFFVHNRIQSIALAANKLQALVPQARIAIAHGQMPEEELERVMVDFIVGKHDILVTTTIIQLGLDIPNVNTLIVDQADKFGLAQLYQLRGRIGRGINQAYAYFFSDKGKQLTHQAHTRLQTIFEATELGAGFDIAMKDMEIRGAGNLLGIKQSGHIVDIGFDLYCQLMAEAVEELKAKQAGEIRRKPAKIAPTIYLPLSAYVPEEYVSNLNTRLNLYHRLATIEHIEEIENMAKEIRDRFGVLPQPVKNLLYMLKIKVMSTKADVDSISIDSKQIIIKLKREKKIEKLELDKKYNKSIKIGATQIRLDIKYLGNNWRVVLEKILQDMI